VCPSYLFYPNECGSCGNQGCNKMVFPAAIREKSQRWVALSCDAHLMFAREGKIRQPCTFSLSDPVSCGTFLISQHFCAGNSLWSLLPHVPLCTAAFTFFFSSCYILLPFCLVCLNRHLPLLGPETHSLQACLSLCPSSNRVLSLSITLDTHLFLLILRPLSSTLLFARLPHGNLGEPSTRHTLRLLRI